MDGMTDDQLREVIKSTRVALDGMDADPHPGLFSWNVTRASLVKYLKNLKAELASREPDND